MKKISLFLIFTVIVVIVSAQQKQRTIFDDVNFVVEPIKSINTVGSDISPFFVNGDLYFSGIPEKYFNKDSRERKNKAFYNIYSASLDENGLISSERKLVSGFDAEHHEGPAVYCEATEELFTTISNVIDADTIRKMFSVENIRLRIVIQKMVDDKWEITEELPFNTDQFNYAHPAISKTGDTLIFSSNMDSLNYGNADLYMSVRSNGEWSEPVNLGETINTPGNEMYPTFISDGLLSFASDGHIGGFGKLDIWYTTFPKIGEIKNIGNKINSHFDEFGLVVHPNENIGYFTSERPTVGGDDIYRLDIIKLYDIFRGKVRDDNTNLPIAYSTVKLTDCYGEVIGTVLTDSIGNFDFEVVKNNCPVVEASKEDYDNDRKDISGLNYVELRLKQNIFYEILVLDVENEMPIQGASIECGEELQWFTDNSGIASVLPSSFVECNLLIEKSGYLNQTLLVNTSNFVNVVNRDTVWLYKKELNKTFVLDIIYYDFDKWDILPESEIELNKLIKIMKDNPDIKVELGSHTDSRGNDAYNERLSQKRSKSAVAYIINNGISKDRIVAKGYGESQLINRCANGVPCSRKEHRKNRRTEFKITGMGSSIVQQNSFSSDVTGAKSKDVSNKNEKGINDLLENQNKKTLITEDKKSDQIKPKSAGGSVYRIQLIATSKNNLVDIDTYYAKINDLIDKYGMSVQKINNLNKYQLGNFSSKQETIEIKKILIKRGYKNCFVVEIEK